jgi:hypothetical protein
MSLKNILGIVLLVILLLAGYYWWEQSHAATNLDSGNVTSSDAPSSGKARMDSGAVDLDGHSTSAGTTSDYGSGTPTPATPRTAVQMAPATSVPPPAQSTSPLMNTAAAPTGLPVSDTLSADPPSGMAFGGNGKFQWYRQGNLTWRINTQSGSSCVAFATMDEWAKPIVYSHGCGNT